MWVWKESFCKLCNHSQIKCWCIQKQFLILYDTGTSNNKEFVINGLFDREREREKDEMGGGLSTFWNLDGEFLVERYPHQCS